MTGGALAAVIFDLDGVLVDSEPVHWRASQRLFAPHDLTEAEYARFIVHKSEKLGCAGMLTEVRAALINKE